MTPTNCGGQGREHALSLADPLLHLQGVSTGRSTAATGHQQPSKTVHAPECAPWRQQLHRLQHLEQDLALLPIGDNFTMGPSDAAEAARMLRARRAVPMHYNTFDLIEVDPGIFKKEAEKHGCQVDVLQPGESLEL